MKKVLLGLAASVVLLSGCATNHDWKKARLEDTNKYIPAPTNYEAVAKSKIRQNVRNIESTVIQHYSGPKPGSFKPLLSDDVYGHVVCYNVNTKNLLGMFTGNRLHLFIFNENNVILEAVQSGVDVIMDRRIADTCKEAL